MRRIVACLSVAACVAGCGARTGLLAFSETDSNGGSAGHAEGGGGARASAGFGGTTVNGGASATGGTSSGGAGDSGGTLSGVAGFSVGGACGEACTLGQLTCLAGGIAKCAPAASGCAEWSAPATCAVNQVCQMNDHQAACVCSPNSQLVAGICTPIGVPRPIAPLSTATVTSAQPVLRWVLANGDDGAQVEICRDRACAQAVTTFSAAGASGTPPMALTRGVYFWRLRGSASGVVSMTTSPVWEFSVGARSASVNTSWGTSPDVNGDGYADVIVGAHNSLSSDGNAYLFLGGASGLASVPIAITPPAIGNGFRGPIASAGDVNGDGFADVIFAAIGPFNGPGGAYLSLGGPSGLATPLWLPSPGDPHGGFGFTVASAGDVNGDGYADVVIGALTQNSVSAYLYLGSSGGLATTPIPLNAPTVTNVFGYPAASAGDVNGDGYADVVIGVVHYSASKPGGHAYVYLGGPSGLSATPITLTDPGSDLSVGFGASVSSAGDMNGDGYADVIIGTQTEAGTVGDGKVYVYFGSSTGLESAPMTLAVPGGSNLGYGYGVVAAGDLDGDGFGDIAVGAPGVLNDIGQGYAYFGSSTGVRSGVITLPSTSSPSFACGITGAGDVNKDGFSELLIGTCGSQFEIGGVALYLGSSAGLMMPVQVQSPLGVGFDFGGDAIAIWTHAFGRGRWPLQHGPSWFEQRNPNSFHAAIPG
ncbi:MAG TPA: VCBS repeat-containing protein [Polyangiaceae bacterium]|nr:VCBS repeat-containing protein [Polyangiaceae bacterium]